MDPIFLDPDPEGDVTLTLRYHQSERPTSKQQGASRAEIAAGGTGDLEGLEGPLSCSFELRVSSKHRTLASPVFKRFLQPGSREGEKLKNKGHARLELKDDDPTALSIFLNIIHGHFNGVSEAVNLDTFTEIAILAD